MGPARLTGVGRRGALRAGAAVWLPGHPRADGDAWLDCVCPQLPGPDPAGRRRLCRGTGRGRHRAAQGLGRSGGAIVALGNAVDFLSDSRVGLFELKQEKALREGEEKETAAPDKTGSPPKGSVAGTRIANESDIEKVMRAGTELPDDAPGALLRARVRPNHWLTAGVPETVNLMVEGRAIYSPVKADRGVNAVYFDGPGQLVVSGHLWSENQQQIAYKPAVVAATAGRGVVVAFTQDPNFRAMLDGANVLFLNAVFRGPAHARDRAAKSNITITRRGLARLLRRAEQPQDVIPFLENVLRGRNVPRTHAPGGGALLSLWRPQPDQRPMPGADRGTTPGQRLPVYWGNRNWHPMLADTLRRMARGGHEAGAGDRDLRLLFLFRLPPIHREHRSGPCRGGRRRADRHKLPPFSEHPLFVEANADRVAAALAGRPGARLVFTAHSIPKWLPIPAATKSNSGRCPPSGGTVGKCRLGPRLAEPQRAAGTALAGARHSRPLAALAAGGVDRVVTAPIGFLSDHMEVLYDLDVEAAALCRGLGIQCVRAGTPGVHPKIVALLAESIEQRLAACEPLLCPEGCCPGPGRRPSL